MTSDLPACLQARSGATLRSTVLVSAECGLQATFLGVNPADLARFFRRVQPREMRLKFQQPKVDALTYDVLTALTYGSRLETRVIEWGFESQACGTAL
jgi:hypothetical protein